MKHFTARFSNGRLKPDQGGAVQFRCYEEKTEPTKERRPRKRMLVHLFTLTIVNFKIK